MIFPGTYLVLSVLGIVLLVFGLGAYWAWAHGQFDDVEAAKYAMLRNDREYRDDGR